MNTSSNSMRILYIFILTNNYKVPRINICYIVLSVDMVNSPYFVIILTHAE